MPDRSEKNMMEMVNAKLAEYLPEEDILQADVITAMRYSLLGGGKRIRPVWCWSFAESAAATSKLRFLLPVRLK